MDFVRPIRALILTGALALPLPAMAQSADRLPSDDPTGLAAGRLMTAASVAPPVNKPAPGVRIYGLVDSEKLSATRSFTAVVGSSRMTDFGAGADIVNIRGGVFARVTFAYSSLSGTRVFVDAAQNVIPLNIPLTVKMTPIEIGGGWRFTAVDPKGRVIPYVGAGLVLLHYQETSDFALAGQDVDEEFTGAMFFGGVEVEIVKHAHVAVEGLYRHISTAAEAGVSATFDENDLGGSAIRFRFGVGF
jgi:hypothetical protein